MNRLYQHGRSGRGGSPRRGHGRPRGRRRRSRYAQGWGAARRVQNLVVIYEENHSFDNLYGDWGRVGGQVVNGLQNATAAHTTQVAQDGSPYQCLLQNDVNLTSPPLPADCADRVHAISSHFRNWWFTIDDYITPADTTCPAPGVFAANGVLNGDGEPGGCTRDLVHRFYQEQYQIDGGRQDRYMTGSDAVGLTMGRYETTGLPIYKYLHAKGAPNYVVADNFFQGAFGGSFLNHQYLIAARSPLDTSAGAWGSEELAARRQRHGHQVPALHSGRAGERRPAHPEVRRPEANDDVAACGNFAVNTVQPSSPPAAATGAKIPLIDDSVYPNIGDRMSAAGVTWNWYSGGWDAAAAGHPGPLFQFHHQPFNYFANYAVGGSGRSHLQDETKFLASAQNGTLPQVSFVKPYGAENEHPGYASEPDGSDHLVDLLTTIMKGPQAKDTLVVVTYDEFGGQWDHVSPPVVDNWGPGTRIPAPALGRHGQVRRRQHAVRHDVDHGDHRARLRPRSVASRDAIVNDLTAAIRTGDPRHQGQDGR